MNAPALDSTLHWLLRTSLEASVLILAVLGLRALLGARLGPAWRIGLWMLVGLKLLLPACIPAGFGLGGWAPQAILETPASVTALPASGPILPMTATEMPAGVTEQTDASVMAFLLPSLALLWLAGALLVFGSAVLRQWRFEKKLAAAPVGNDPQLLSCLRRLQKLAEIPGLVEIRLLPAGSTPAITGLGSPRLLLPEDWQSRFDEASLRHVLLHELLHVRHRDLLWNWAAVAVQAVHWFNPLVWVIGSRFQADRELRCDAAVLRLLSPNERLAYGHTLLRIQETFFAPPAMAGLAPCVRNHPTLLQRITMIAQPNRNRPWLHAVFTLAFGVMTCYAFTTAQAAEEKAIPAKDRSREGQRSTVPGEKDSGEAPRTPREGDGKMTEDGQRDGDRPKTGTREGDGAKKPGTGDREGSPQTGPRDGDSKKTGPRDGEKKTTGARDGDRPKTGERDDDKPKKGAREGERTKSGEGDRGGKNAELKNNRAAANGIASAEVFSVRLINKGESVMIQGEEIPMDRLRGYLHQSMAGNNDAFFQITADSDVPYKGVTDAMDALRDNGKWNVMFAQE
jgi:beta-lactamase regulating signal transducer with metallopeptidase domain